MPYKSKEDQRAYERRKYEKNRIKVLDLLGGSCEKCGISDYDVLQIDHIEPINKSCKQRTCNTKIFRRLVSGLLELKNLQILCANCHMKKTVIEHRNKRKL